jgi:hypothetical protein
VRNRRFRLRHEWALPYVAYLMSQGISLSVECATGHVDVITPFELAPQDFPDAKWLKQ